MERVIRTDLYSFAQFLWAQTNTNCYDVTQTEDLYVYILRDEDLYAYILRDVQPTLLAWSV